jgi:hypothetical protein
MKVGRAVPLSNTFSTVEDPLGTGMTTERTNEIIDEYFDTLPKPKTVKLVHPDDHNEMRALLRHCKMFIFENRGYCDTAAEERALIKESMEKLGKE